MNNTDNETKDQFTDLAAAIYALVAVVTPFLELHRAGARGEHDSKFDKLYAFQGRLAASEFRSPVVNVCHTVGSDAITGGYLTFTYADGRSVEHPLDLHGAAALLREKTREAHGRFGEEQKALLAKLEARIGRAESS
jgi:hypothetical protein